jgi:hypothetical protein
LEILAGDLDGADLFVALADWSAELRILLNERRRQAGARRREERGKGENQALTE